MRSKVQKEINQSNKVLGKLTDKQIERYHFNNFTSVQKEQFIKFVSEGGVSAGNILYENKKGLFGMTDEAKKVAQINGGIATSSLPIWKEISSMDENWN